NRVGRSSVWRAGSTTSTMPRRCEGCFMAVSFPAKRRAVMTIRSRRGPNVVGVDKPGVLPCLEVNGPLANFGGDPGKERFEDRDAVFPGESDAEEAVLAVMLVAVAVLPEAEDVARFDRV